MSHWVSLNDKNGPVRVDRHADGGTYVLGGTESADINITYNYAEYMWQVLGEGGVRALDGKRAGDVIDVLAAGVATLGTNRDRDYWTPTAGNAGYALSVLLSWARLHPDASFEVR